MTYYDKYHCINCPVYKYCGTMVSTMRLCHSYRDSDEDLVECDTDSNYLSV